MGFKEFITAKTRASLSWFVAIVLSIAMIIACCKNEWATVQFIAPMIVGLVMAYQGSQAYTKGLFIKKVGEVNATDINKTIEP